MRDKKLIPVITYLNAARDAEILVWLERQHNKSAAIRELLFSHVQSLSTGTASTTLTAKIDQQTIRQAVTDAMGELLDLSLIRQVVEVAVTSALSGLTVESLFHSTEDDRDEDPLLDHFDETLIWE